MEKIKMNKKIGTLLLTGMTVMSMGTTAFAADATALAPTGTEQILQQFQ